MRTAFQGPVNDEKKDNNGMMIIVDVQLFTYLAS